jgi:hypothetical protein
MVYKIKYIDWKKIRKMEKYIIKNK